MKLPFKKKPIVGIIAFLIGVFLIFFSLYEKHRIAVAKGNISSGTSFFSGSAWGKVVKSGLESEASKYDTTVQLIFIAGIVIALAGAGFAITYRKK